MDPLRKGVKKPCEVLDELVEYVEKDHLMEKDLTEEELLAMSTQFRAESKRPPLPKDYVRQCLASLWALHRRFFLSMDFLSPYYVHPPKLEICNKTFDDKWNTIKQKCAEILVEPETSFEDLKDVVDDFFKTFYLHSRELYNIIL